MQLGWGCVGPLVSLTRARPIICSAPPLQSCSTPTQPSAPCLPSTTHCHPVMLSRSCTLRTVRKAAGMHHRMSHTKQLQHHRLHALPAAAQVGADAAVVVFSTPGCPYCRKAKQTLAEQQVQYKEVDVSTSSQLRTALQQATGARTVPQVFVHGTLVGGSDSLSAQVADGSFAKLLAAGSTAAAALLPEDLQQALDASLASAAAAGADRKSGPQLPPELLQLARALSEPQAGIPRSTRSGDLHSNAFTGRALLDWLQQHSSSSSTGSDRQGALQKGQQLLAANIVTLVSQQQPTAAGLSLVDDDAHWYRLRSDAPRDLAWGSALNTGYWWGPTPARPAEAVAEDLRGRILALYDKHLSTDGKAVRYKALKQDPAFWEYVDATAELQRVDLSPLSREALMCFAINLYNTLCIHTLVVHGPDKYNSSVGRVEFFRKAACYNIGGVNYVLDDLENGILRSNAPGAATLGMLLKLPWLSKGPFKQGDPRAQHVVTPVDARIHFALNCGAASCPAIKMYTTDTLEEGLTGAAEAFCASEVTVDVAAKKVNLSKIFGWYYPDFGPDKAARLRFLLPYLPADKRSSLETLLAGDTSAGGIRVEHAPYDWTINAAVE